MIEQKNKASLAERLFCIGFFAALAYFLLKYAAAVFLPFIIAYLVSLVISPLARAASEKLKLPRRLVGALLVVLIIAALGAVIYWGISRLVSEVGSLLERLQRGDGELVEVIQSISGGFDRFFSNFSLLDKLEEISGIENISERVTEAISEAVYAGISRIPQAVGSAVGKAPQLFISFFVAVMASYYFASDGEKIRGALRSRVPDGVFRYLAYASHALKRYARGYLLLMLMTFIEAFLGLAVLGVRYSFLIAAAVAVVDILPVLGAGTVLIPWAIFAFLIGNYHLAVGLLILYGIMTIIRQLTEPKIIGSTIGLHPIASLFSMYAGFRLFGIWGMILGPAVALMLKEFIGSEAEPKIKY